MKILKWMCLIVLGTSAVSCKLDPAPPVYFTRTDFSDGKNTPWVASYTDYTVAMDTSLFEFKAQTARLPLPSVDSLSSGFMVSSHNRSDDLFTYITQKLSGFAPNMTYSIEFSVDFLTNAADSSVGIGGSPGHSVYMKAGASGTRPARIVQGDRYTLNLDKGNQSQSGTDLIVLGDIANGTKNPTYKNKQLTSANKPIQVKTNDKGEIWLIVGTDSGFEGKTTLYYRLIEARYTPLFK